MQVYEQGEDYQEDEFSEENLDDEVTEDTESRITSIYNIPIKIVAIVAAIALVVVLIIVLFATRKKSTPEAGDSSDLESMLVEDTYTEESYDPAPVETTSSEDLVYDPSSGLWVPADSAGDVSTEPVEITSASTEEMIALRAAGYTGDEIEYCLENGFSVQALLDASKELQDKEASDALIRMSNTASEEFRYIIDNTYFSQVGYVFESVKGLNIGEYDYTTGSYTVNADYVKCPTYGAQLQLKCRVAQDLWVWYVVTPERWDSLPDEGNIVLRVNYTQYGVNTYVTSVMETDPTLDTIDSSSATSDEIMSEDTNDSVPVSEPADSEDENGGELGTE